ncbi:GPW/gp25 family protein [Thalassovita aquimarina]|uniref:GPW/gp25 family protein n=1 Tax=Thalassovita aquimarina TaxID=2785917 RepID=A0ABS5HSH9_9RHOB|nr:GPW/gp25 family protein [Thalassovita aquimarina]MBR9651915.1 GPW/gp25 family protein [Thalassovita aquimarina]
MDLNHDTGGAVEGWAHVVQSIQTILVTRLNTRVFRREFGSEVPALVDAPMNDANVLALYVAVAEALERWEPRFELTDVQVEGSASGAITMTLIGNHLPNAHMGDMTKVDNETQTIRVLRDRVDNWSLAA